MPQSLVAILNERKERTRLGLSKFTAEAAEQAAEHRDKLGIAGKVKDVADVHKTLWPNQPETNQTLNLGVLIGQRDRRHRSGSNSRRLRTHEVCATTRFVSPRVSQG